MRQAQACAMALGTPEVACWRSCRTLPLRGAMLRLSCRPERKLTLQPDSSGDPMRAEPHGCQLSPAASLLLVTALLVAVIFRHSLAWVSKPYATVQVRLAK